MNIIHIFFWFINGYKISQEKEQKNKQIVIDLYQLDFILWNKSTVLLTHS